MLTLLFKDRFGMNIIFPTHNQLHFFYNIFHALAIISLLDILECPESQDYPRDNSAWLHLNLLLSNVI